MRLFDLLYIALGGVLAWAGFGLLGTDTAPGTFLGVLFVIIGLCVFAFGFVPVKR